MKNLNSQSSKKHSQESSQPHPCETVGQPQTQQEELVLRVLQPPTSPLLRTVFPSQREAVRRRARRAMRHVFSWQVPGSTDQRQPFAETTSRHTELGSFLRGTRVAPAVAKQDAFEHVTA